MPYKRVNPVSEEEIELADEGNMNRVRYLGHHTICEKCREIYRIGKAIGNEELMLKAREAMAMGKRMHEKLKQYRERDEK